MAQSKHLSQTEGEECSYSIYLKIFFPLIFRSLMFISASLEKPRFLKLIAVLKLVEKAKAC